MAEVVQNRAKPSLWHLFIKDARNFQILYLSIFLVYGIQVLDWERDIPKYIIIISTCLATQAACIALTTKNYTGIKSGMITALGLCLLLRTEAYWLIILAAFISIASKFVIRFKKKHIFNPANFGLTVALFTGQAYISPGQWGSDAVFVYFVGFLALVLLLRVGRVDVSLAFLGSLFILNYCYDVLYKGWPIDHVIHSFTSGSLLLFSFFMITDPMTTPNTLKGRIIWIVLLAIGTFVLTKFFFFNSGAPIYMLFFVAPLTILIDRIFKGEKYEWGK